MTVGRWADLAEEPGEPFLVDGTPVGTVSWLREQRSEAGTHRAGFVRQDVGACSYRVPHQESFVVVDGVVEIRTAAGVSQTLGPGDAASFARETECTFHVTEPLVRFCVISQPGEGRVGVGTDPADVSWATPTHGTFEPTDVNGMPVGDVKWLRRDALDAGVELGVYDPDSPFTYHLAGIWRCDRAIEFPYNFVGDESFYVLDGAISERFATGESDLLRQGEAGSYVQGTEATCVVDDSVTEFFVITR